MCRHLYNWSLAERIEAWEKEKRSVSYTDQQNQLPTLKKEKPWYKDVHSQVLQDVLTRLDKAYKNFFREKKGYPKFKAKDCYSSITYTQYSKIPIDKVELPKIGKIALRLHRNFPENAQIKTLTIKKEADKWFACFSLDIPVVHQELKQEIARGIDLGLESFLTDSEGQKVETPSFLKQFSQKIARLQRKIAQQKKGSARRKYFIRALQKVFFRLRCKRTDWLHKTANSLVEQNDLLFAEKLHVQNMLEQEDDCKRRKTATNQRITDVCWSQFLLLLCYKMPEKGKYFGQVPSAYTSQRCSICGRIEPKTLEQREHICSCGCRFDRDHNAAKNILALGLESLTLSSLEAPTRVFQT